MDSDAITRLEVLEGKVGVSAARKEVNVETGEGTLVEKNKAPSKPRKLLAPPALADFKPLYRKMPLDFQFENVPEAKAYHVMIARDKSFKDVIKDKVIDPREALKIVGADDGLYYLQSSSVDDAGLEAPLEAAEINVRVNPLPPFIQSPADGADLGKRPSRLNG
ncbi:MAG: hypothetical protein R2875_16870 [Desulfobacterales bacterium]